MPLISRRSAALNGDIRVPGDKSVSHRALILGASAVGETRIHGLLEGEDVLRTAAAVTALGAQVEKVDKVEDGIAGSDAGPYWRVRGRGVGGLAEPASVLDLGNSGTGARLLMGLLATHPFTTIFTGDASLASRPMGRVLEPLSRMGANFTARKGDRLPVTLTGAETPVPIRYVLPVASAQVKSALLLAGLNTPGRTTVVEPRPTRDHTETLLTHFGATVTVEDQPGGGRAITLTGQPELTGRQVTVPGDISSAAFPLVAAVMVPGSHITIGGVGVNVLRAGLLETLAEMGARITLTNRRRDSGEDVADLEMEASPLTGIEVPAERAPAMIDEYPILAMAAATASGTTHMTGLGELRVKESDRLAAIARGLAAAGVQVEKGADTLTIHGSKNPPRGGVRIQTNLDHRIAMAFLTLGLVSEEPIAIDDSAAIETSFPGFAALMNGLGARMSARTEEA